MIGLDSLPRKNEPLSQEMHLRILRLSGGLKLPNPEMRRSSETALNIFIAEGYVIPCMAWAGLRLLVSYAYYTRNSRFLVTRQGPITFHKPLASACCGGGDVPIKTRILAHREWCIGVGVHSGTPWHAVGSLVLRWIIKKKCCCECLYVLTFGYDSLRPPWDTPVFFSSLCSVKQIPPIDYWNQVDPGRWNFHLLMPASTLV